MGIYLYGCISTEKWLYNLEQEKRFISAAELICCRNYSYYYIIIILHLCYNKTYIGTGARNNIK